MTSLNALVETAKNIAVIRTTEDQDLILTPKLYFVDFDFSVSTGIAMTFLKQKSFPRQIFILGPPESL
ncbi:MAG: hypothetical protein OM95_11040 [Bdellovibrio sp. ArHS]|nr:MAG: hypothetical protein OM95_11040 [Bdellovibrio sp. ArHS]